MVLPSHSFLILMSPGSLISTSIIVSQGFAGGPVVKNRSDKQEMGVRSVGQEDVLEKEKAIHSSILTWDTPWTEEPGRLQSTGLQRVRYNWVRTFHSIYIHIYIYVYNICMNFRHRWIGKDVRFSQFIVTFFVICHMLLAITFVLKKKVYPVFRSIIFKNSSCVRLVDTVFKVPIFLLFFVV